MLSNLTNYFLNLNSAGQALFIVGILLIITFIILLIVVFKPEKNKVKKIYGENAITDSENIFDEKMKDIDNIGIDDINLDNDRTRNLKNIVDELKLVETKSAPTMNEIIEAYEDEQEDTAIISVEELLKNKNSFTYEKRDLETTQVYNKPLIEETKIVEEELFMEDISHELTGQLPVVEEKKYTPKREIFSSVYTNTNDDDNNEAFLNSLKQFRSNL